MGRIRRIVADWWILVPLAGVAGIVACGALAAFGVSCGPLGLASVLAASTAFAVLIEEPVRSGRDERRRPPC